MSKVGFIKILFGKTDILLVLDLMKNILLKMESDEGANY